MSQFLVTTLYCAIIHQNYYIFTRVYSTSRTNFYILRIISVKIMINVTVDDV